MHMHTSTTLLLSAALFSAVTFAAPAQLESRFETASRWPKPEFDYYTAVGDTIVKAAMANQLVNMPPCNMDKAVMPQGTLLQHSNGPVGKS